MRPVVNFRLSTLARVGAAIGLVAGTVPAASATVKTAAITKAAGEDARAIDQLLATYQAAVSHKDEATFETLLLSKDIPFAFVPENPVASDAATWRDYDGFRKGVFAGPALTQTFSDVHVRRHGALADVDLIYSNSDVHGVFKGWKTMQLIKVAGRWKIASEFFTDAVPARR